MVKDWAYKVAFDRKDLPSLREMVRHVQETHDTEMIERFNNQCEQLSDSITINGNNLKPKEITKTADLVVNVGLQQCINIIQGSAARWSHIAVSMPTGALTPTTADTSLNATLGPYVIPMATYGWMEAKGMRLFFSIIGPQESGGALPAGQIGEMGVCNGLSAPPNSILLNRENFFNNKLTRTSVPDGTVYASVWFISCVVEFCPTA
jgi:hypothetical protein